MAVIINDVYQKVLAIANKEQRGYITPQEFNLFANQAQMDIFEQYFYDINQFGRVPGNSTEYSDPVNMLEEKISAFEKFKTASQSVSSNVISLPTDLYRLGTVFYTANTPNVIVEKVNKKNLQIILSSPLTAPTETRPVFVHEQSSTTGQSKIRVFPTSPTTSYTTSNLICNYIKKPATVKWTYTVSGDYKALYNGSASDLQNFELHESEENNLVTKILQLAGISIKDTLLIQTASTAESSKINQQKQ
tara:strand:+ start:44 stop:787 length:744 start_codon:yes stop_codon:yes gene_type:complete